MDLSGIEAAVPSATGPELCGAADQTVNNYYKHSPGS